MTVGGAISKVRALRPGNTPTTAEMTAWLSEIDAQIFQDIICTHHVCDLEGFPTEQPDYDPETDSETVLIAKAPHDRLYLSWLESKIDYTNGEYARYNNSAALFNAQYSDYRNFFNHVHRPKTCKLHLL